MSTIRQQQHDHLTATEAHSSFGELLREHRIAAGLTQERLAERAGLSVHGIQKLEQGVTHPYRDSAQRLATALQLSGLDEANFHSVAQPLPRRRRTPVLVPVVPIRQVKHNLPLPTTSFIDDAGQMAAVMGRLQVSRLVTITGSGGCGKTRLAVEVGLQLMDHFADGVWFVDLAPVAGGADVPEAIATTLRIVRPSTQSTLDAITQYLQTREALIILDNCEHLVEACARVADTLMRTCADVRLMPTSRELLQIDGEASWRVGSLSVISRAADPNAEDDHDLSVEEVLASEAGRLFLDRAGLVLASFTLTPQNAGAVAQIGRRLDGIPLALELAAARLTTLSVDQIADRLDHRFRLLTGGSRTALRRQQTLQATIDWSYQLLSEQEQALLRALSIFVDGWSLEAAEALVASVHIPAVEVMDLLGHLVAKSMVVVDALPGAVPNELRYRLLESIRDYAEQKLIELNAAATLRDAHCDYFLSWAEPQHDGSQDLSPRTRVAHLSLEQGNLRAALEWTRGDGSNRELRLVAALGALWVLRGNASDVGPRLRGALERCGGVGASRARAEALQWLGWFELLPEPLQARAHFEEALVIARQHGALQLAAQLSRHLVWAGDELDAPLSEMQQVLEEGLAAAQAARDARMVSLIQGDLGWLEFRQGHTRGGKRRLTESLKVLRGLGEPNAICSSLLSCGAVALEQYDSESARQMLDEALGIARALAGRISVYQALMLLAELSRLEGDLPGARALIGAALREVRNTGLRPMVLTGLRAMGGCWLAMGNAEWATQLFGAEATVRAEASVPSTLCPPLALRFPIRYVEDLALARASLSVERFSAAWALGEAMPLEVALARALDGDPIRRPI